MGSLSPLAKNHAVEAFNQIVDSLLDATRASRTTLRLDWPQWDVHVDGVIAEARRPNIPSLAENTSIKQRDAETVKWLERERHVLVQEDCSTAKPAPPRELVELYGVRAQMLAPVVRNDRVIGWISVHDNTSSRRWTHADISALTTAVTAVQNTLDKWGAARRERP